MIKYCPKCGSDLKENFKFCPSCGYQLKEEATNREQTLEVIICNNCGEENSVENYSCSNCGVKLKGGTSGQIIQRKEVKTEVERQSKTLKGNKKSNLNVPAKQLELNKILIIGSGIVVIGLIILLVSGIFDKTESNLQTSNIGQNQSSGFNPSSMQRINELEAKVKANPSDTETLLQLAHLRNDNGLYEEAIINYNEYLNKVPDDADARIDMGVCYYNMGKYEDAKREMIKALEYKPDHQIAHLNLGIVNLASGNLKESKEWFKKAAALNPDSEIGKRAQELLQSH
jgi:tetratricopeptide (TPR) repeat protein